MAYPTRALIVEATWADIERGGWRSQLTPQHIRGSLLGWIGQGLPVLCVNDHAMAREYAARWLYLAARRRWRQLQAFKSSLKVVGE